MNIYLEEKEWEKTEQNGENKNVYPGKELAKDPCLVNEGSMSAWAFIQVFVPIVDEEEIFEYTVNDGWELTTPMGVWTPEGIYYTYRYKDILPGGTPENPSKTPTVFDKVKISEKLTSDHIEKIKTRFDANHDGVYGDVDLVVNGMACQQEGFDTWQDAFEQVRGHSYAVIVDADWEEGAKYEDGKHELILVNAQDESDIPQVGDYFMGSDHEILAVYDIDHLPYYADPTEDELNEMVPWHDEWSETIVAVYAMGLVYPDSTAHWFDDMDLTVIDLQKLDMTFTEHNDEMFANTTLYGYTHNVIVFMGSAWQLEDSGFEQMRRFMNFNDPTFENIGYTYYLQDYSYGGDVYNNWPQILADYKECPASFAYCWALYDVAPAYWNGTEWIPYQ